jgi:hypothetical protein
VVLQNSQYTVKLATGDYSQDTIADGIANLLIGRQPPNATTHIFTLLVYAALFLVLIVQITAIVRSIVLIRGWQLPERRPQGSGGWYGMVLCR